MSARKNPAPGKYSQRFLNTNENNTTEYKIHILDLRVSNTAFSPIPSQRCITTDTAIEMFGSLVPAGTKAIGQSGA